MAENLVNALERLRVDSAALEDDWIDHILNEPRPRKRVRQDPEDIKNELEKKYLTPSRSFSTALLNKVQQWVMLSGRAPWNETDFCIVDAGTVPLITQPSSKLRQLKHAR